MSGRFSDYDKGSSRSARDDSRTHRESRERRSRSPHDKHSPTGSRSHASEKSSRRGKDYEYEGSRRRKNRESSDSEEEVPAPPPPPRISKISMGFSKPKAPIKMNIFNTAKPEKVAPKPTVASVFNEDDDDEEPEEMPAEARMRMRNIGRETPTSAGPNSFGKTKQGFCDAKKVFEKNLKEALDTPKDKPPMGKFPQTIYKIKPSS